MTAKKKIVIIEDNHDLRDSLAEYLELAGFEVTGVSRAIELYQVMATDQQIQLAIVDIGLPDQDGLVLAEYIRKNSKMRIVMLTAQDSLDSKVTAYRSGADLYLVKPVDFSELTASISSILSRLDDIVTAPEEPPAPKSNPWALHRNDTSLSTPSGPRVTLTVKEFTLLEMLADKPGSLIERSELLLSLDYGNDELGNRALDALVHRLRRKSEELGQRIPVKTWHGTGFSFAAPIVID